MMMFPDEPSDWDIDEGYKEELRRLHAFDADMPEALAAEMRGDYDPTDEEREAFEMKYDEQDMPF